MTTIAVDTNGNIAADGLAARSNMIEDDKCQKLIKRDGVIYAMAGRLEHCMVLVDYLSERSDEIMPDIDGNVLAIENGHVRVYWLKDGVIDSDLVVPPYAMGSGADFAYSAMKLGMTAKEAVKHAAGIDLYTGGKITSIKYKKV